MRGLAKDFCAFKLIDRQPRFDRLSHLGNWAIRKEASLISSGDKSADSESSMDYNVRKNNQYLAIARHEQQPASGRM